MSRSKRRAKSEVQLRALEEQFTNDLLTALKECAAGTWGLLGRNDAIIEREWGSLRTGKATRLIEIGEEIESLRRQLGIAEPFSLFQRYLQYRQMQSANAPGEPKLATLFLKEIGEDQGRGDRGSGEGNGALP
jgi:hypothetical protein